MSQQPQQTASQQPDDQFVIATLNEELAAANNNRLFLIAASKQLQHEAQTAITRVHDLLLASISMVADDENREKINAHVQSVLNPQAADPSDAETFAQG